MHPPDQAADPEALKHMETPQDRNPLTRTASMGMSGTGM
jgi:hypothetical protein